MKRQQVQEGNAQEFGQVSEYFLPPVPKWIDFSTTGQCFKNSEIEYLNYQKVNESYGLDYSQMVELQGLFHDAYANLKETKETTALEKNALFYETMQKINGGVKFLDLPKYDRFYLLWIDRMNHKQLESWLDLYRDSEYMNQGVPVLVSFCYTRSELIKKLDNWNLGEDYPHMITAESFSIYSEKFNQGPRFFVDLTTFFSKKSEIYLVLKEVYKDEGLKELLFKQGYKRIPFN